MRMIAVSVKRSKKMAEDGFDLLESRRYCHRLSLAGQPLHYHVIVGRKNGEFNLN
jgi:hypothetical protein